MSAADPKGTRTGRVTKSGDRSPQRVDRCPIWPDDRRAAGGDRQPRNERASFRAEVWSLRRLLRNALGSGADNELMSSLNQLAKGGGDWEQAFVIWFDLIEVLVQHEERRYEAYHGRGAAKKAGVEQVIAAILRSGQFQLPRVPDSLMPVVMDFAVDWAIDSVVFVINRYGLWTRASVVRDSLETRPAGIGPRIVRLLLPLEAALASLFRMVSSVTRKVELSDVKSAIKVLRREALIAREESLVGGLVDLVDGLASHRDQFIATPEIVFEAVQKAEGRFDLPGRDKKRYARDLVLATLDELGFTERTGLVYAVVDSLLNGMIEVAVHLFNKRGIFRHVKARRPPATRSQSASRETTSRY